MRSFEDLREDIGAHGAAEYPREACGVVVFSEDAQDLTYVRCTNLAAGTSQFTISPLDLESAAALGEIRAIVHTHPDANPTPSAADRRGCLRSGLPWIIVNIPDMSMTVTLPEHCEVTPLIGRTFEHGVMDCYTLIQDYYASELGIDLPDHIRADKWWERGENLYVDNILQAGFRMLSSSEPHQIGDVILFTMRTAVPTHGAVFVANDVILHHLPKRLSCRQPFLGVWPNLAYGIYRHRNMERG